MGNLSYRGKFQRNFDQGKANLVDLAENSSYRGYCSTVLNSPESDRVIRYIKLIRVRFHYPFATTTTVMSPVNKKEPINGFPCILNFPVHIGRIYKLTLISSYVVTIRRHITKQERTFTFHNPADFGHDWKHVSRVSNKIYEHSAF